VNCFTLIPFEINFILIVLFHDSYIQFSHRFATSKYREPSDYNTGNMFMHLTNYSINKNSRMYSTDDEVGTKRKISTLNRILANEGYDVSGLWNNIDDIIIKTVMSALPMLKHNYNACFPSHDMIQACFEVLGMDILIDSKLKPYILEVNHSPSFHTSEQVDKEVKENLIRDTFQILNLTQDIKKKVLEEDRKRIRDRLLQKIKDKDTNNGNGRECCNDNSPLDLYLDKQHGWAQQFAWEDTHLGGFRRIMPCPNDRQRYQKFQVQQNQLSVYSETAASKRREECAKQQRIELEEKFKYNQSLLRNFKLGKSLTGEEDVVKKKKNKKQKRNFFKPDDISDMDERERVTSIQQREYLIKTVGLLQTVS
jgi:tubulin polyglutamylase TTLL6/13